MVRQSFDKLRTTAHHDVSLTPSKKGQEAPALPGELFALSSTGAAEPEEGILHPDILEFLAPPPGVTAESGPSSPPTKILPAFSEEALDRIRHHFIARDGQGIPTEVVTQMISRVAEAATHAERRNDPLADLRQLDVDFYNLIAGGEFIPDAAILRNAGRGGTVVSPAPLKFRGRSDEILSLLSMAERAVQDGLPLSILMEKSSPEAVHPEQLRSLLGAFLETRFSGAPFQTAGEFFVEADHPDLGEMLSARKLEGGPFVLRDKVVFSDAFMQAVGKNGAAGFRKARDIFREIVYGVLDSSDFSAVFSSRPQSLLPLQGVPRVRGTINLATMVTERGVNWERLKRVVQQSIHFLDNVLEGGDHFLREPLEKIRKTRALGLGVTGLADLLNGTGVGYGSEEALLVTEKIASFVKKEAALASSDLAKHKGVPEGIVPLNPVDRVPRRRNVVITEFFDPESASLILSSSRGVEPSNGTAEAAGEVSLDWILRFQAVLEKFSDGWVFKEIPLRPSDGPEDVARLLLKAHRTGLSSLYIKKLGS